MRVTHIPAEILKPVLGHFSQKHGCKKELDRLSLGELIALCDEFSEMQRGRLSEGIKNSADKINKFRNSYVHARNNRESSIPSEHDAVEVIRALLEVLDRTYEFLVGGNN